MSFRSVLVICHEKCLGYIVLVRSFHMTWTRLDIVYDWNIFLVMICCGIRFCCKFITKKKKMKHKRVHMISLVLDMLGMLVDMASLLLTLVFILEVFLVSKIGLQESLDWLTEPANGFSIVSSPHPHICIDFECTLKELRLSPRIWSKFYSIIEQIK